MNYRFFWVLLISHTSLFCAFRNNIPSDPHVQQQNPPVVYVPVPVSNPNSNPIEADKKTDEALFGHFLGILGNFSKILINPHDKTNVTSNVTQMVDGVVSVFNELTKRNNLSDQQLDNLVRLIILALIKQGFIPPSTVVGFTIS